MLRPPTACATPGCSNPALPGSSYCAACKPTAPINPRSNYSGPDSRPWQHLYNKARWNNPRTGLRATILRRDPLCKLQLSETCKARGGNPSSVADHIIDHQGNERLFWDPKNLQGVCSDCHAIKTAGSMSARRNQETDSRPALDSNGKIVEYGTDLLQSPPKPVKITS